MATEPSPTGRIALPVLIRSVIRVAVVIIALAVVYAVAPLRTDEGAEGAVIIAGLMTLVVLGGAFLLQIRRIVASEYPMLTGVEALLIVLTVFIIGFSFVHASVSAANPAAYSEQMDKPAALYFTVTVLSTVGFGDITPRITATRMLVAAQMLADLAFIAVSLRLIFGIARQVDGRRHVTSGDASA